MRNTLICGDNLEVLSTMDKESVDLIYIDPPFFSNRHYEIIWGDEAEIRSFDDRWEGGINVYIDWMKQRVTKLYSVLNKTGSFYLHCDSHASHYLKVMCDEIFGKNNFRNELVWCYSIGGRSNKTFAEKHDVIFWYTKSGQWTFNADDPKVRVSRKPNSHMKVIIKDGNEWQQKIDRKSGKEYLYPLDKVAPDYWTDIEQLNREDKERYHYPTQKPVELLERIISSTTAKGDTVLDGFCGCGTTLVASQNLDRKWVGIDISPSAIALIKNRFARQGVNEGAYDIVGMPKKIDDLRTFKPYEFQYWVVNEMHGDPSTKKSGDMGIDGISFAGYPIQVKQSDSIGRNVVDNFETALRRYYKESNKTFSEQKRFPGFIVAFSFGKGAYEEVARAKREGFEIELVEVQDILDKKLTLTQVVRKSEKQEELL